MVQVMCCIRIPDSDFPELHVLAFVLAYGWLKEVQSGLMMKVQHD